MGYVDIREREGLAPTRQHMGAWHEIKHNPYVSIAAGLILTVSAALVSSIGPPYDSWSIPLGFSLYVIVAAFALRSAWQQSQRRGRKAIRPKPGGEKQLLMAIRDSDGLTPVEAALETSLTVDEADELLSRLAERSHLHVQSHNGALYYTLPGRRYDSLEGRTAPGV
jgi:hypothetical protein